ncbi:AbrB family transcriptional regulator (plasmid) [Priestia filamentosa]|uniref:AbrB family transcriptional regulator n=1 Tax=Priestia filamentosa TaxID=1402861 RepID=A0A2L1FFM0_9BACI|nr:AbrB/MazE/SpoVT family DNA-binding domain-containing protein [Priestia filamentosa]AVD54528.1 AbrB/MazE/SpoVT family DNA-binding domain-containing protein [Priestia filamentosa]AVD54658.1 AbrB/MazE/SpoVT family DNA-binding domain-containing protein [Priestia filamentosa]AWG44826.1 AbrB family transcriptional regulator [Priestia filamentosa]
MRSTGIVRKVDQLGRIVIPKELRRTLAIEEKDLLEFFVNEDQIILKKYQYYKTCMITGKVSEDNIVLGNGKVALSREGMEILSEELRKIDVHV